jgi:hypothetical protein
MLRFDPVGALASVRLEGFDSVPGFLHRASHEAADGVFLPSHGLLAFTAIRAARMVEIGGK